MKKILLAILFCLLSIFTFANDWEFGSEGEHIIPLKGSNMSIKKEKITLKLTPDGMLVNVKFTFDNPTAENKIVGFVTPESGNGGYYEEENVTRKPEPLNIKNFKTTVNGKEVKSNVELLSKLLSRGVLDNNIVTEYVKAEKEKAKEEAANNLVPARINNAHIADKPSMANDALVPEKTRVEKVNDAKHELANIQNELVKNKRELGELSKVLESNDKIQQNWDNELAIKKKKFKITERIRLFKCRKIYRDFRKNDRFTLK